MTRQFLLFTTALISAITSACSGVNVYNRLAPRDSGVEKIGKDIAYGNDPRQRLDVYKPKAAVKAPVIVFMYGGSWNKGRRQDYGFVASSFAAKGYVTVVPDYRLVPQVHFPAFLDDGARAVAWVQAHAKHYGADPTRIFLLGHSAGAYNVVMLGLNPDFLKAAGVDIAHIRGVIGLSGPYDFYPWDTPSSKAAFGSFANPALTQPITFVRKNAPPMLLLTGADDTTVRPRNTVSLASKLKALGAPVQTKQYPAMKHAGIVLDLSPSFRHRAPVLKDIVKFIEEKTAD
jgi:acetyl esterase/lipase